MSKESSCTGCTINLRSSDGKMVVQTPSDNEERRLSLRMALRLSIVVSGRMDDGAAWSEPTETSDVSTSGALFRINQKVECGEHIHLRALLPDGTPIQVTALITRVTPAIYGMARVGVSINEPQEDWLRLFVAWVAEEKPDSP